MAALLFFCLSAIAILAVAVAIWSTRKRARQVQLAGRRLGSSFAPATRPFQGTDVEGLNVLEDGCLTVAENVLELAVNNTTAIVFDLTCYCDGATAVTTVAAFRSPERLPKFHIDNKGLFDTVEEAFGRKFVNFKQDQEFTRRFRVLSYDEGATRTFLTNEKRAYLRSHAGQFRIDCSPDWMLVYKPGKQVRPEDLPKFAETTARLASALLTEDFALRSTA